jgi:hypothetical protein
MQCKHIAMFMFFVESHNCFYFKIKIYNNFLNSV